MANEIRISVDLSANRGAFAFQRRLAQVLDNTTVKGGNPGTISLTTSETVVSFGSITPGWVVGVNLSTSNSVRLGPTSGTQVAFSDLPPKAPILFHASTGLSLRARTVSGTADLELSALSRAT